MSTRGLRGPPLRGYVRNSRRRRMALDVDLNALPSENHDQEGTSANAGSQDTEAGQQGVSVPPAPIDVEAFDDDVIISSPRAFAEAKNSRRNHGRSVVVDVDSEERTSRLTPYSRNRRRRVSSNQTIINCDLYINLEGSSYSTRDNVRSVASPPAPPLPPPPPPPPPKEPTFSCPVCMGPLVEEMSTKCGHIFCKTCIKAAIASQSKCPTCRRKVTMKDTIRVYLPATS
uniref:RING-type domain-containing protein n=1 Tax=Davidia involucrata TaxID=16924 RepID=A0A5B7BWT0_DAVIN